MIDQIDLTDMSVNQLVMIYNFINRDVNTSVGYNQQKEQHDILRIKKKLINMGQLSNYVLHYEGKL
tara:strand:+ start:615 stop:812 length:198 start_codon:yes stop_codon:yes gene_type:complete